LSVGGKSDLTSWRRNCRKRRPATPTPWMYGMYLSNSFDHLCKQYSREPSAQESRCRGNFRSISTRRLPQCKPSRQ
jgi:hypothetical protein